MTASRRWTLALALLAGCGDADPAVEVSAYVGPAYARHDPQQRLESASEVARTIWAELRPERGPGPGLPSLEATSHDPVHAPTNAAELEALRAAIATAPTDELGGPARRLAAAGPEVWPQLRAAMLAERTSPKGDYRSLLDAIGGDVPNRYGHFARAWKKAHGHRVTLSEDWFEDLLMLPGGRVSPGLRAVHRDCVAETAMFRAAARIGREHSELTGEVVAALLDAAYLHEGTFRDEVGRAIESIGDEAIPHLLVESLYTSRGARDDESVPARRAEYAELQLDRMDRLHPARATEAVRDDPRRLALVLHAYATVRPGGAAPVLLEYADVADPSVRAAARAAFTAYVTGPPPVASRRTVRLLGGGTASKRAHLTFRQRASLAIRQQLERDAPELLEPECETQREDGSFDLECEAQPERLARAYFGWLDQRRHVQDQWALAAALAEPDVRRRVDQLDRLLVGNPGLTVGPQLVPVYREAAEAAQAAGDMARAGQLLRKASRLAERDDPAAGEALRLQALLAESSVPGLTREGRQMLLASAAQLSPEDPRVDAALASARHRGLDPERRDPRRHWAPVAGMFAGLWGLGLLGSWRRRRHARDDA